MSTTSGTPGDTPVDTDNDAAFAGLRVVDLSQGVAGPHCGMLFAQHGADVVKVEPVTGDWGRAIGRSYGEFCAYNIAFNRGKRSLAIDLKDADGLAAIKALLDEADVVIENYRPGVLTRFGLDYAAVRATNKDVVFVSVTGFGQTGSKAALPATDSILQSFSGLMTANRDDRGVPQRVGVLVIDVVTGLYAFQGASAALYKRAMRGGGRHVQVSLMESIGAVQAAKMIEFHLEGPEVQKPGVPVGTFATADGFVTINARRDVHFNALCEFLGLTELCTDPRFDSMAKRAAHEEEILSPISSKIREWTSEDLVGQLKANDILHAKVNDFGEYMRDEHVREAGIVEWIQHAGTGDIPMHLVPGIPATDVASAESLHSPALGEHSRQILSELGWSDDRIQSAIARESVRAG